MPTPNETQAALAWWRQLGLLEREKTYSRYADVKLCQLTFWQFCNTPNEIRKCWISLGRPEVAA